MYGFVAATKVDENFMSQVLEHVFLANGVSPVNKNGFSKLDEKATSEVLNFYKKSLKHHQLVNFTGNNLVQYILLEKLQ